MLKWEDVWKWNKYISISVCRTMLGKFCGLLIISQWGNFEFALSWINQSYPKQRRHARPGVRRAEHCVRCHDDLCWCSTQWSSGTHLVPMAVSVSEIRAVASSGGRCGVCDVITASRRRGRGRGSGAAGWSAAASSLAAGHIQQLGLHGGWADGSFGGGLPLGHRRGQYSGELGQHAPWKRGINMSPLCIYFREFL